MPVPLRRLAVVVAAAAAVILVLPASGPSGLLVVNAIVLAAALVDWLLAPPPSSVTVERTAPSVLTLEAVGSIEWLISNPRRRPLTVAVADELAPSLRADRRRAVVRVPGGGQAMAGTEIRPARRGRFDIDDLAVRTFGPLGLMARQRARSLPWRLRVYPPFRSKDEAELRINRARILEVGLRSARGRGGGTDFDQLRDYTPDDESRRIDWAATARVGKPIVRTFRAERNQTVLVLLDNGRVMAGRVAGVPRVEHAMDAVMMLTAVASRLGDRTGLVTFDQSVRSIVPPGAGAGQLGLVTEAMYDLEPVLVESDYEGAFSETLARFRRRAMIVVLTELADQAVREFLLPALPLIAANHLVVVAAARDPQVTEWATSRPTDASAAYRRAAATQALADREQAAARLRGAGATVVDAAPGDFAPQLADVYLKVKATGGL